MNRVEDLEKRWLKYKIKQQIKYYLTLFLLILSSLFLFYYIYTNYISKELDAKISIDSAHIKESSTKNMSSAEKIEDKIEDKSEKIAKKWSEEQKIEDESIKSTIATEDDSRDDIKESSSAADKAVDKIESDALVADEVKKEDESRCYEVSVRVLNIRDRPSLNSTIIGKLYRGDRFCSYEERDGWILGQRGWAFAAGNSVEIRKDTPPLELEKNDLPTPIEHDMSAITDIDLILQEIETKPKIEIERKKVNSSDRIANLERRFSQNRDAKIAIEIGKLYLKEANLLDAQKWTLVANKMNPKDEESWILFAKIKRASGDIGVAIKILDRFLSTNESTYAKELLRSYIEEAKQ